MADREQRTASCIDEHTLRWAQYTVWAKSDAHNGGASSCLFYGFSCGEGRYNPW
jgi:hypothetical protein